MRIAPPLLPLVLWKAPPGLELMLRQEGVPTRVASPDRPASIRAGRFVLYDGRINRPRHLDDTDQVGIDLREIAGLAPPSKLIDHEGAPHSWEVGGYRIRERICRVDRASIRRAWIDRLKQEIGRSGGVWARLSPYPHPYRSAFNFRVDLDEPEPADYFAFARARRPLNDCTTHFACTAAYGPLADVLDDLRGLDTQSHGHHHHVYRDPAQNLANLRRADAILRSRGFEPTGFAGPGGRWNRGLGLAVEELGYGYSSEFQTGYDDWPFFPWLGARFSTALQLPIHPVCEGIFLEAGLRDPSRIAEYLAGVLQAHVASGTPAFLYGHPEGRLGRYPSILARLAKEVAALDGIWRVTLTEFARWWRWRDGRSWSLVAREPGWVEAVCDDWDPAYPLAVEIARGGHSATIPIRSARTAIRLDALAYERRQWRADLPAPLLEKAPLSLRGAVRRAIDWELVTPLEELPSQTWADRLKCRLRRWKRWRTTREGRLEARRGADP
ncbi:MAG: hypothetical protein U0800_01910 [Isosphaeraceae bacterium]